MHRNTRLSRRDLDAEIVWRAMRKHADEIADVRDVLRLEVLRGLQGERIRVSIADLVAQGRVVGATGGGRIRAVDPEALFA